MSIRYCTKEYRRQDGKFYYTNIFSTIKSVKMCIAEPAPIFKIDVIETKEIDENSYYGWLEFEDSNISYIYPHLTLFSVCFPYGYKAEEERGIGKLIRVKIIELEDVTNNNRT